ncbi:MAG: hypothetical protein M5U15_03490 [Kiritimatiellae bacterium]|nr:hypothetical protein [Kiritimatiellia bacterium]
MDSNGEIFFRCTACRRRLAIESSAVGQVVDCPNCRASLLVPNQSTSSDPIVARRRVAVAFVVLGFLGFGFAGWLIAGGPSAQMPGAVAAASASAVSTHDSAKLASPSARHGVAEADVSRPSDEASNIRRENENLLFANRAMSKQYEELANWVLRNLKGRFLLKQDYVGRLRFEPVDESFKVNAELADFLTINQQESGIMNEVFQYSRSKLLGLQQSHLSATQDTPARVTLYIPPFEREGATVREDLYGALQTALGSERFDRLLQVGEKELTKAYDYFGSAARTMVFEVVPDSRPSAPPFLLIRDAWAIPQDASRRTTETSEEAVTELPARYNAYLAWLPDFISAYAKP